MGIRVLIFLIKDRYSNDLMIKNKWIFNFS